MMSRALLLIACCLAASASAASSFTWGSCGFRTDRLLTKKVAVTGTLAAGQTVHVTASGATQLHVPLDTGAWQVRIYEDGEAKSTSTAVGDLMTALTFDDAKNTTFTVKVSFPLPKKMASGKFSANLVAVDQAKANYMCIDIKYSYAAPVFFTKSPAQCTKDSDCPSSYCQNGVCHACGDACCMTDKDCPGSYCANDATKMPPYTCHGAAAKVADVAAPRAGGPASWTKPNGYCPDNVPCAGTGDDKPCTDYRDMHCADQTIAYCKYNGACKFRNPPPPTAAKVAEVAAVAEVAPLAAEQSTPPTAWKSCKSGDLQCAKSSGEGSYCKYWLDKAVCQGSNKPCQCSCRGDDFCRSAVRPDSYCKYWQLGAGKVCQYSNKPCDCQK